MNKQQTAVEWLIDMHFGGIEHVTPYFKKHIEEAKEMEKEQTKSRAVESYYLYTQYLEQLPKVGGATVEMHFEQWYERNIRR